MSHKVFLSGHLKSFSNGQTEFRIGGHHRTVGDLLAALWREQIALRDRILNERGEVRTHVNIFYQGEDIRRLEGLRTGIDTGSELHIFNAVSGG